MNAVETGALTRAIRKVDETIEKGEPLLQIHARSEASLQTVLPDFQRAVQIS